MSTAYELLCKRCKQRLWVGQSAHLYSTTEHLNILADFLHEHRTHELEFVSEHDINDRMETEEWDGYVDYFDSWKDWRTP